MNHDLILTFCDPITKNNEYDIPFILANNNTAIKWLRILYEDIYIHKRRWNNDRYVGFETNALSKKTMAEELNKLIEICEKERPGHFKFTADENISQHDFNRMHVWFEVYRGSLLKPHPFFTNGSNEFKYAIERFNQVIHMWEKIDRFKYHKNKFIITFDIYGGERIKLTNDDLSNFDLNLSDDSIYLSYIMRGKNLVDLWVDDDHHVGDENIRPYQFLGSNFLLRGEGWTTEETLLNKEKFNHWFDRNSNYLNSLGFQKNDPRCTVGWLPLAHSTIPDIKEIIEPRQFLKNIKIFEEINV